MKLLAFALTVLASAAAMAYPAVGDMASYSVAQKDSKGTRSFALELKLTAYDAAAKVYAQQTTVIMGSQKSVNTDAVKAADMVTNALVKDILTNCAGYGGKLETITIKAGKFNTCALTQTFQDNGVTTTEVDWVADVPFAIAKVTQKGSDGSTLAAELASFAHGK